MSFFDITTINNERVAAHEKGFRKIFGVSLKDYYDPITGFDIVKFDYFLKAGSRSVESVVRERYGEKALKLIETLTSPITLVHEDI